MSKASSITTAERVQRSLDRSQKKVMLRSDFERFGSPSQLSRILSRFIVEGRILRVSSGVYVRARPSSLTGAPVPDISMTELVNEVFKRLGVEIFPSQATRDYNDKRTTQLPGRLSISTGKRRITRTVQAGAQKLIYEKPSSTHQAGAARRGLRTAESP